MNERSFAPTAADLEAEFTFEIGRPRGRRPVRPPRCPPFPRPLVRNPGGADLRHEIMELEGHLSPAQTEPQKTGVAFAPLPPPGSYWPVRTSHPQARLVSYRSAAGKVVGWPGRVFTAGRKGKRNGVITARNHAGVDLFAYRGDAVIACENGTVIDFKSFLKAQSGQHTYNILVEHSGVVVNYGEVRPDSFTRTGLKVGSSVRAGQVIGYVSDTRMLHFETYTRGSKSTYRWWKGDNPPQRLLDPTRYLLHLAKHGASAPRASTPATAPKAPPPRVQRETSPIQGATSLVVGEERTPPALTRIVKVPLCAVSTPEWRQWSAVYFPPAVDRNSRTIDVILYLHGYRTEHPGSRKSILDYLKHKYWPLREHLAASGKAAVLIAPTLGPRLQPDGLREPGGLDRYLDATLAATASYWSSGVAPAIRNIVLAGHSAAGVPMRVLARSGNRYAALIKEVWGFDCTYSSTGNVDSTGWAAWARAHPQSQLFIYYLRGGPTQDQALKLRKLALRNVSVIESNAKTHFWVPIQHWGKRLAESPYLRP